MGFKAGHCNYSKTVISGLVELFLFLPKSLFIFKSFNKSQKDHYSVMKFHYGNVDNTLCLKHKIFCESMPNIIVDITLHSFYKSARPKLCRDLRSKFLVFIVQ